MTTKAAIREVMAFLGRRNKNNDARRRNVAKAREALAKQRATNAPKGGYSKNAIEAKATEPAHLPAGRTINKGA